MLAEQAELYLSILCLIFHVQSAMGNAPLGPDWRKADIMSKAKVLMAKRIWGLIKTIGKPPTHMICFTKWEKLSMVICKQVESLRRQAKELPMHGPSEGREAERLKHGPQSICKKHTKRNPVQQPQ